MFGIDVLTLGSLAVLSAASPQKCELPQSPRIVVTPRTDDIKYHMNMSSAQLSRKKSDTVSPYAAGTDSTTGGLRVDKPKISMDIRWKISQNKRTGKACIWYDRIDIDIHLRPEIYIAQDFSYSPCKEAIIEHELKHVTVDRKVMNKYAREIGNALRQAVDRVGAIGPYDASAVEATQTKMGEYIQATVNSFQGRLNSEMDARQQKVDSLQEYERISKICHAARNSRR